MKTEDFFDRLNFNKLMKNLPAVNTSINKDGSKTEFFEYDAFIKWFEDYCYTVAKDVSGVGVVWESSTRNPNAVGYVNGVSATDFVKGRYYSDIYMNTKYFKKDQYDINSDESYIEEFVDSNNNNKVKGFSMKNAFELVSAVAHEARHIEQSKHLVSGSNDKSLNLTMSSGTALSFFDAGHFYANYFCEPIEVDAQNMGLIRGFAILNACFPGRSDTWFDCLKNHMWRDERYSSYTWNVKSEDVKDFSVLSDIMSNSFMDSCIDYDKACDVNTWCYQKLSDDDKFKRRVVGHDKFKQALEKNPSYIKFFNDYMVKKLGNVIPDILKEERFVATTGEIDGMADDLNAAAREHKNSALKFSTSDIKKGDLYTKAKNLIKGLIPKYDVFDYKPSDLSVDKDMSEEKQDVNKKLKEITGIDFDQHEKEMKAVSVISKDENYNY